MDQAATEPPMPERKNSAAELLDAHGSVDLNINIDLDFGGGGSSALAAHASTPTLPAKKPAIGGFSRGRKAAEMLAAYKKKKGLI